jgi:hypothetical protein
MTTPSHPAHRVRRSYEELVAEADAVSVDGWDFSRLDGRATEQRPSWSYQQLMAERLAITRRSKPRARSSPPPPATWSRPAKAAA